MVFAKKATRGTKLISVVYEMVRLNNWSLFCLQI